MYDGLTKHFVNLCNKTNIMHMYTVCFIKYY